MLENFLFFCKQKVSYEEEMLEMMQLLLFKKACIPQNMLRLKAGV